MDAQSIISGIKVRVGNDWYGLWTIGVTDDPDRRKKEHDDDRKNTFRWSVWNADT